MVLFDICYFVIYQKLIDHDCLPMSLSILLNMTSNDCIVFHHLDEHNTIYSNSALLFDIWFVGQIRVEGILSSVVEVDGLGYSCGSATS